MPIFPMFSLCQTIPYCRRGSQTKCSKVSALHALWVNSDTIKNQSLKKKLIKINPRYFAKKKGTNLNLAPQAFDSDFYLAQCPLNQGCE